MSRFHLDTAAHPSRILGLLLETLEQNRFPDAAQPCDAHICRELRRSGEHGQETPLFTVSSRKKPRAHRRTGPVGIAGSRHFTHNGYHVRMEHPKRQPVRMDIRPVVPRSADGHAARRLRGRPRRAGRAPHSRHATARGVGPGPQQDAPAPRGAAVTAWGPGRGRASGSGSVATSRGAAATAAVGAVATSGSGTAIASPASPANTCPRT